MFWFLIVLLLYVGILLFYKSDGGSLKAARPTFKQNFKSVKASLFSGVLLLTIFLLTSLFTFSETDERLLKILALNNVWSLSKFWPFQVFTHLFIHFNFIHVLVNVVGIGLASMYERRVGSRRFLAVLAVGSFASIPSLLFYSEPACVFGISGGVMALGAAYFTDYKDLTIKEWIYAVLFFFFFAALMTLSDAAKMKSGTGLPFQVDYVGHLLGAIGGIIYCRLRNNYRTDVQYQSLKTNKGVV